MGRAPQGGITIQGIFYRGGQFLPMNDPKRGSENSGKNKNQAKVRKIQVGPYQWVLNTNNQQSLWNTIAGSVATFRNNDRSKLVYCGTPQVLKYKGMTETQAKELIDRYNNGEIWL